MIKFTSKMNLIYMKSDSTEGFIAMATTDDIARDIAKVMDMYYNGPSDTDKMISDIEDKLNDEK